MLLTEAVPWGRLASEYIAMFGLTSEDRSRHILDCGGGPSSFTSESTVQGGHVVSCDPLYEFSTDEIRQRIDAIYPRMTALTEANRANFLWDMYGSPTALGEIRMRAMRMFLDDYVAGKAAGRYVLGGLPALPFPDASFDLALCSHFLFTYSEQFTTEFHIQSLLDMARVAREVRVFPILNAFDGVISPHLPTVMQALRERGYVVDVRTVEYEFQKGGNQVLCVTPYYV